MTEAPEQTGLADGATDTLTVRIGLTDITALPVIAVVPPAFVPPTV